MTLEATEQPQPTPDDIARAAERQTYIGGSDAAGVVGLSRWSSPVSVWAEKVGLTIPRTTVPLRMWIGQYMEPMLAEMTTARIGLAFVRDRRSFAMRDHPYIAGHVDFRAKGAPVGLEVKTARSARGWGDDGTPVTVTDFDAIPIDYYVQVQHYLMITGWHEFIVGVLIGHDDFRTYRVEPNPDMIRNLLAAEVEFWDQYVVPVAPPPVDGSDAAREYLRQRYPTHDALMPAATPEQDDLIAQVIAQKRIVKDAKALADAYENRLRAEIGSHAGLLSPTASVTWRKSKDSEEIDWSVVALAYRNILEATLPPDAPVSWTGPDGIAHSVDRSALDAIVSLYTYTKQGTRRLLVHPLNGDEDV